MSRKILVALADTHAGHKLGLMNPDVELQEEGEDGTIRMWKPEPTAWQSYLWKLFQEHVQAVRELAGDDAVMVLHIGDATQGDRFGQHLVSRYMHDQVLIARDNLAFLFKSLPTLKVLRVLYGTGVHVWDEGSSEKLVTELLRAQYTQVDIQSMYHGLIDIEGFTVDASHHGPAAGSREWLKGNVARFYLRDLMLAEIAMGYLSPGLVLRGHVHEYLREVLVHLAGDQEFESMLVLLPSYCGISDHARKSTKSEFIVRNGMVVFELVDGRIRQVFPFTKVQDVRTYERIT